MKTHKFYVQGTHCEACKILIEDTLRDERGVHGVEVSLVHEHIIVSTDREEDAKFLAEEWTSLFQKHGYALFLEKPAVQDDSKALYYAGPLGLLILVLFILLQKSGVLNLGFDGELTYMTALMIGVIASLSTCLAVVGGLVLSLSAKISQDVRSYRPFVSFHLGRLIGFALLGGVLGLMGGVFEINYRITAIFGIIVALVMIILGLNLLDVFRGVKKIRTTLPRGIFDRIMRIESGAFAPFIIGIGTFFLPCGFTQSMQIAALASGSFASGSLIMVAFAFGTLPMLSALSFGSFRFSHTRYAPMFFKTAGVVVIGLGIFALMAGMAGLGVIRPLFNI